MGGREPAAAAVHPGSERWEDTALCGSSCPFLRGCSRGPHPACVLHVGHRGNTDEGGESAWSPASWCAQKRGQGDVGVAGRGCGHGRGRAGTEDVGGHKDSCLLGREAGWTPTAGLDSLLFHGAPSTWPRAPLSPGVLGDASGDSQALTPGHCFYLCQPLSEIRMAAT